MRGLLEASLVSTISVVVTVAIMMAIFPRHARVGGAAVEGSRITPAVLIDGPPDLPNSGGTVWAPSLSDRSGSAACPYLEALAAAGGCPATPRRNRASVCPYLLEQQGGLDQAEIQPENALGQHI
jgi:hypothetical protein